MYSHPLVVLNQFGAIDHLAMALLFEQPEYVFGVLGLIRIEGVRRQAGLAHLVLLSPA